MTLKITETSGTYDYRDTYSVAIERDGKRIKGFYVGCIEPEDATLGRDLSFAYAAVEFFKLGYEAGRAGEEVLYESCEAPDEDYEDDL